MDGSLGKDRETTERSGNRQRRRIEDGGRVVEVLSLLLLFLLLILSPPATFFDPWWRRQRCLTSRKHCPEEGGDDVMRLGLSSWVVLSAMVSHLTKIPRAPPGQSEPPTIENPRPGRPGALWRGWWNTCAYISFHWNQGQGLVGARRFV